MRHQSVPSLASLQAEWIPMLTDCTSELTILSQVENGRLQSLLQWLGSQRCSCWKPARATCLKKRSRLSGIRWETGQQPVVCLTVALVTCLVYKIRILMCKDHESKASSRRARVIVTDQASDPYINHQHHQYLLSLSTIAFQVKLGQPAPRWFLPPPIP